MGQLGELNNTVLVAEVIRSDEMQVKRTWELSQATTSVEQRTPTQPKRHMHPASLLCTPPAPASLSESNHSGQDYRTPAFGAATPPKPQLKVAYRTLIALCRRGASPPSDFLSSLERRLLEASVAYRNPFLWLLQSFDPLSSRSSTNNHGERRHKEEQE